MTQNEIMALLAKVHNALYELSVSREQTLVVGQCIQDLRAIVVALRGNMNESAETVQQTEV